MTAADFRVLEGRYQLRNQIGHGAMGQVWHGYDLELDRHVALKTIHPARLASGPRSAEEETLRERFRREARMIARLDHPGIPAVYDARLGPDTANPYMVMELVPGEDLERVLRSGRRFSVTQALSVAARISEVLTHLHAAGVVHRDLKPANIMVTGHQGVKVIDLGVAAMPGAAQARLTEDGQLLGTCAYMAPEQFDAPSLVTEHSDLYALGCMLYELLVGEPPFTGPPMVLMRGHCDLDPKPLRDWCPDVDPALDQLVMECLAKPPGRRPASARALRQRLGRILDAHAQAARQPAPFPAHGQTPPPELTGGPMVPPPLARTVGALALYDDGRFEAALPEYMSLAEEWAFVGDEARAADCRSKAAHCLLRLGDAEKALHAFSALVDLLVPSRPSDDLLLLDSQLQVALLLERSGQSRRALAALAHLYPTLLDVLGSEAPPTTEARDALVRIRRTG
ncbi:serine/threonine-protein kinase [Streptomyces sp. RerS4]|uniref:serine/threonine-protein kinase n=1 Tax=Streptomyces sp. RerS4 TaxID=2942449 RepID=UPI00201BF6D4|nr:serine/threonine-protein kinase [Streptomyces sp. RerS4]UQX04041.1 serine/threonine protein kinase [Streptomyces sp. RerS4]